MPARDKELWRSSGYIRRHFKRKTRAETLSESYAFFASGARNPSVSYAFFQFGAGTPSVSYAFFA